MLKKLNSQNTLNQHQVKAVVSCYSLCKAKCGIGVSFSVSNAFQEGNI